MAVGSVANAEPATTPHSQQLTAADGEAIFRANCASCHGLNAEGTENGVSLIGVGAASVNFQVMTGRMPMAMQGPQALQREPMFTQEQSDAMGDVRRLARARAGPAPPRRCSTRRSSTPRASPPVASSSASTAPCATTWPAPVARSPRASSRRRWTASTATHVYEAMITGPQNMPVFNDANISPEQKREIIAYLHYLDENPSVGGFDLGNLGPVSEGLFIWIFGLGGIVAITVWLTSKPN